MLMDLRKLLNDSGSPLETICSSIVDAVVVADSNRNFVYWNESARQLLATGPDDVEPEVWAKHFKLYYVDTDTFIEKIEDLPMIMALNGKTYSDYRVMTKNEHYPDGIILSVNGKPILNDGQIVGALTTFRDVTAEVRLDDQLKKERAFFRSVIDLMPSMVCIKDLEGKFIYVNNSFEDLSGYKNLIGMKMEQFLSPETVERIKSNEKLVLETKTAHEFEEVIYWKDNRKMIFHATRFPYKDANGRIIGICGVLREVTKELETKMEIEQERNKTSHISKLAAIGILAAEIAHEIKNPLTIMRTNNDVIRYALDEEEIDRAFVKKKMAVQNETIDRMDKVAGSLSMLSKDTASEVPVIFKLSDLLDDIKSLTSYRTRKMGIEIEVTHAHCAHVSLNANRVQISEVLLNVIMNALDAIEHKSNPKISIYCEVKNEDILIKVFDNGPGVDSVILNKIFEPFFTTKDFLKGTGLGLSISKKIVLQHRGNIYYDVSDKGHAFVIQLPMAINSGEGQTEQDR